MSSFTLWPPGLSSEVSEEPSGSFGISGAGGVFALEVGATAASFVISGGGGPFLVEISFGETLESVALGTGVPPSLDIVATIVEIDSAPPLNIVAHQVQLGAPYPLSLDADLLVTTAAGSPAPLSLRAAVTDTIASPPPLDVVANVYDPSFPFETDSLEWEVKVFLDGVDVTANVTGPVDIEAEEGLPRIAQWSMRVTGTVSVPAWVGKDVTVDFSPAGGAPVRLFTGVVDVPQYHPPTNIVSFICTDQLNTALGQMTRPQLSILLGGYWSPFVFDPDSNSLQYAFDRMSTVPASVDMDAYGQLRSSPWAGGMEYEYDGTLVLDGSESIEMANRSEIVNTINAAVEYRYPRLKYREVSIIWTLGATLAELAGKGFTLPTRAMVDSAAQGLNGGGWTVLNVGYTPPPPSQIVSGEGGDVVWVCSEFVRQQVCWGAGVTIARRFSQYLTEHWDLKVYSPRSLSALGKREQAEEVGFEVPDSAFSLSQWEQGKNSSRLGGYQGGGSIGGFFNPAGTYDPTIPTSGGAQDWQYDVVDRPGYTRADATNAIDVLVNKARTSILASHRLNRASFEAPLNPFLDLTHRVAVQTPRMHAVGKVCQLQWMMNAEEGRAVVKVTMAISSVGAVGLDTPDPLAAPEPPVTPPAPAASTTVNLGSRWGCDDASFYPQPLLSDPLGGNMGYHGNRQDVAGSGFNGAKCYTNEFRLEAPAIEANDLNPLTVYDEPTEYIVAVPEDTLELTGE